MEYSKRVTPELAALLKYHLLADDITPKDAPSRESEELQLTPTYADVIDWLRDVHNIVISLEPSFTFSLSCHVSYYIRAYRITDNGLTVMFEDPLWADSFELAIKTIVETVLKQK